LSVNPQQVLEPKECLLTESIKRIISMIQKIADLMVIITRRKRQGHTEQEFFPQRTLAPQEKLS
jgi:hypothetical protein